MTKFPGFPKETFAFLEGIHAHNDKTWFDANRELYEAGYVEPAREFVIAIGPKLKTVSPGVQYSAKVNGSMSRINRDIRFTKDKRPYKEHLGLWFWHADRRRWDVPGFWFELTPKAMHLGVGLYMMEGATLDAFRQSIIHPRSGKALLAAVEPIRKKRGYEVLGKTRKLLPRGFTAEPDRAEFLLHEGLYVTTEVPLESAMKPGVVDLCIKHYKTMWPIGQWLLDEVSEG